MTARRRSKSINVLSSIPLSELPDEEDDGSLSPLAASACVLPSCCRCLQDIEADISSKVSAYRSTASVIVCSDDPAYHHCCGVSLLKICSTAVIGTISCCYRTVAVNVFSKNTLYEYGIAVYCVSFPGFLMSYNQSMCSRLAWLVCPVFVQQLLCSRLTWLACPIFVHLMKSCILTRL